MTKVLTAIIILVSLPTVSFGTAQEPDVLHYKGKEYALYSNPLESYYEDESQRPSFLIAPNTVSSGNWRGVRSNLDN